MEDASRLSFLLLHQLPVIPSTISCVMHLAPPGAAANLWAVDRPDLDREVDVLPPGRWAERTSVQMPPSPCAHAVVTLPRLA
jgi:hypothetical protein